MKIKEKIRTELEKSIIDDEIKKVTAKLGDYEILEDRIICRIDGKKIAKLEKKTRFITEIPIQRIFAPEKYENRFPDLRKPIYFIFDGINFKYKVSISEIFCGGTHIIFKNCVFNNTIKLKYVNTVTFENNTYNDTHPSYLGSDDFLEIISANKVSFVNEKYVNSIENKYPNKFGMDIKTKYISFENSEVTLDKLGSVKIDAEELKVSDTSFKVRDCFIESSKIKSSNFSITALETINVFNEEIDGKIDLRAPNIKHNSADLVNSFSIRGPKIELYKILKELYILNGKKIVIDPKEKILVK